MSRLLPQTGHAYAFLYPRHNFHGVLSGLEPRRVLVTEIRDLKDDPLDPETFELQPLVRRDRLLVTGEDLDKNAVRSFYVASMRKVRVIEDGATTE